VYANDLAVKAVLELSKERFFEELEFRFIGDGPLFEDTLAPLRQFDNVIIEQKFLSRLEIADLHKQYGVFLCPSRMDTQGVSRDEAMASGLIPITNAVAAIPEFVNTDWNILADGESYMELVKSIKNIVNKPDLFNYLNREVVDNIFSTRSSLIVNELEIGLLGG
jgi:glycosyltransferase involved in cell wall biosynthesis